MNVKQQSDWGYSSACFRHARQRKIKKNSNSAACRAILVRIWDIYHVYLVMQARRTENVFFFLRCFNKHALQNENIRFHSLLVNCISHLPAHIAQTPTLPRCGCRSHRTTCVYLFITLFFVIVHYFAGSPLLTVTRTLELSRAQTQPAMAASELSKHNQRWRRPSLGFRHANVRSEETTAFWILLGDGASRGVPAATLLTCGPQ